MVCIVAKLRAG